MKKSIFSSLIIILVMLYFVPNAISQSPLAISATSNNTFNQMNCGERPVHSFGLSVSAMDKEFKYGVRGHFELNGDAVWAVGGVTFGLGKSFQFSPMLGTGKYFWDINGYQDFKVIAGAQLWTNYGSKNLIETSVLMISNFDNIDLFRGRTMFRIMDQLSAGIGVLKEMNTQWSGGPIISLNLRPVNQVMAKLDLGYMMTKGLNQYEGKIEGRPLVNFTLKFTPW